jgi:riboflavin kinase/FMN adenylyltransferase
VGRYAARVLVIREDEPLVPLERTVVTVGVFDGVHLGHQHLLAEARALATATDGPLVGVVFDRHPNTVVNPEAAPLLLSDLKQRLEWLDANGVDLTYILRFDEERSLESPADFVRSVLVETLHAGAHVSGEDHHFGHRAQGDVALMAQLSVQHGIKALSVPMLRNPEGDPISARIIRQLVVDGDVVGAAALLARPFELHGVVEHGDHRGRSLGFPTANVAVAGDMALPRDGVYAGWYLRPSGEEHPAAINIGRRPTFYDDNGLLLVEAHLLDFDDDLYGERPRVRFLQRLRDEVRFDGLDSLIAQLQKDVAAARKLLT